MSPAELAVAVPAAGRCHRVDAAILFRPVIRSRRWARLDFIKGGVPHRQPIRSALMSQPAVRAAQSLAHCSRPSAAPRRAQWPGAARRFRRRDIHAGGDAIGGGRRPPTADQGVHVFVPGRGTVSARACRRHRRLPEAQVEAGPRRRSSTPGRRLSRADYGSSRAHSQTIFAPSMRRACR